VIWYTRCRALKLVKKSDFTGREASCVWLGRTTVWRLSGSYGRCVLSEGTWSARLIQTDSRRVTSTCAWTPSAHLCKRHPYVFRKCIKWQKAVPLRVVNLKAGLLIVREYVLRCFYDRPTRSRFSMIFLDPTVNSQSEPEIHAAVLASLAVSAVAHQTARSIQNWTISPRH